MPFYFSLFLATWSNFTLKCWSILTNRFRLPFEETYQIFDYSFSSLTRLIDIPVIITWVVITAFVFYRKRWKIESFFMLGNLALAGLLIVTFKNIYQRPRPAILHLVEEKGFSFPSGHSLAVTLMVGTLIVILSQRIKNPVWRKIVQIVLGLYLVSVLVSRVYLGVHYPSDVLASLCVGLGVLFIEFPFYDKLRFQWRFKGKQK